jgi:hypothetical protein
MRNVFQIDLRKGHETLDQLNSYELLALIVRICLRKISLKIYADIKLTYSDYVTLYETSLTIYTLVNQATNFKFTDIDLVKEHYLYEEYIEKMM